MGDKQPWVNPVWSVGVLIGRLLKSSGRAPLLRCFTQLLVVLIAVASIETAAAQQPRVLDLEIKHGRFTASNNTVRVTEGDKVELRVTSDRAGELHLHGYDVPIKLKAGIPTVTLLDARVAGRFPITSHGFADDGEHKHRHHKTLLYLEVYPR